MQRAIVSVFAGSRIAREARAIYNQRAAIAAELIAVWAVSGRRGCIPDCDGMDGGMRAGNDSFRRDAGIDKGPVMAVEIEVIDDRGVIINLRDLARRHAITAWMRVAKMSNRHKRETVPTQAEIETDTDGEPVIKESNALAIHRAWRQWCPAAVIVRIPPRHPRRTPNGVRRPAPAPARNLKPAASAKSP